MIPSQGLDHMKQYGSPHINMLTEKILDVEVTHNFVFLFSYVENACFLIYLQYALAINMIMK